MKIIVLMLILGCHILAIADSDMDNYLQEVNILLKEMESALVNKSIAEKIDILMGQRDKYANNNIAVNLIDQELSVYYSLVGDHSSALMTKTNEIPEYDKSIPKNYSPVDAVNFIVSQAKNHQIIMINEAHNISQHRVLTLNLLEQLWHQGYRYFAVEALSNNIEILIDEGVLLNNAGYYTREAIFANLLFKAKELGFEIISYDQHKARVLNTIDERESNAALSIKELIFDKNPKAKVIFHVGYSHIYEDNKWLANKLKSILNLNPLTIDQTKLTEESLNIYESIIYSSSVSNSKMAAPFVFVNEMNKAWSLFPDKWDISLFWPRTVYISNRPSWVNINRQSTLPKNDICEKFYPCIVEVYRHPKIDDIPTDRVIINSSLDQKKIFLNKGGNIVKYLSKSGKELHSQILISN